MHNRRMFGVSVMLAAWGLVGPAWAGFTTGKEARDWCQARTLSYLQDRGYVPYNWSATTYLQGEDYITQGQWRIDVDEVKVECSAKKGAAKRSGKYRILSGPPLIHKQIKKSTASSGR